MSDGRQAAFREFLRRVWREDLAPKLRNQPRAGAKRRAARIGGQAAGAAGLLLDGVLRLKGRPFTRAFTVLGVGAGAALPDVWDWRWFKGASKRVRHYVSNQVRKRAESLPEQEALALFGLKAHDDREALRDAWRDVSRRWHPDHAPAEKKDEYHMRFVAYQAAYERLTAAYEEGRLPRRPTGRGTR